MHPVLTLSKTRSGEEDDDDVRKHGEAIGPIVAFVAIVMVIMGVFRYSVVTAEARREAELIRAPLFAYDISQIMKFGFVVEKDCYPVVYASPCIQKCPTWNDPILRPLTPMPSPICDLRNGPTYVLWNETKDCVLQSNTTVCPIDMSRVGWITNSTIGFRTINDTVVETHRHINQESGYQSWHIPHYNVVYHRQNFSLFRDSSWCFSNIDNEWIWERYFFHWRGCLRFFKEEE